MVSFKQAFIQYEKTKEKGYSKKYSKTSNGRKIITISSWKRSGLIDSDNDNYQNRYEAYIATTHCDVCYIEFKDSFDRCLDHHHETGLFRQFLCRTCNCNDHWKKLA